MRIYLLLFLMFPLISNSTPLPSDCQTNAATLNTCAEIKIDKLNKELDRLYKFKVSSLKNPEYVKLSRKLDLQSIYIGQNYVSHPILGLLLLEIPKSPYMLYPHT